MYQGNIRDRRCHRSVLCCTRLSCCRPPSSVWLPSHRGDAQPASDLLTTAIDSNNKFSRVLARFCITYHGKKMSVYHSELIVALTVAFLKYSCLVVR